MSILAAVDAAVDKETRHADDGIDTAKNPAALRPLRGLAAIVTGSTSSIGLSIARALTAAGADVTLIGSAIRVRSRNCRSRSLFANCRGGWSKSPSGDFIRNCRVFEA
jgi:hypothetical protein